MKTIEERKVELRARIQQARVELAICEAHLAGIVDAEGLLAAPRVVAGTKRKPGRPRKNGKGLAHVETPMTDAEHVDGQADA